MAGSLSGIGLDKAGQTGQQFSPKGIVGIFFWKRKTV
jgi:hypothetical protein